MEAFMPFIQASIITGGRCEIRTHGTWLRRPVLYPTELIAHAWSFYYITAQSSMNKFITKGRGIGIPAKPLFHFSESFRRRRAAWWSFPR